MYGQLCGVDRSPPTMRKYSLRLFRSLSSRTRRLGAFNNNLFVVPHFNSGHFTHVNIWVRLSGSIGHVLESRICCDGICEFCEIFEIYGPGTVPNLPWTSGNLVKHPKLSWIRFNSVFHKICEIITQKIHPFPLHMPQWPNPSNFHTLDTICHGNSDIKYPQYMAP